MVRAGDFYEFFEQDAVEASDALGLTLTGREVEGKPTRVPMCGIPIYQESDCVQKLLDKGYKVAIDGGEAERTDEEIARILPAKGSDILRLYENRFSNDRFYVNEEKGEVTWLYFNPDSTSGGQFIESIVTFEQISTLRENEDYTVFFDKLGTEGKQYIIDSDDEEFRDVAIRFLTEKCSFRGYSSASREILVSMADEREKEAMKDSPNRFSIREVPYEAGRVGIWDASIKKYLGENGQLYLFAEQADAEEYLKLTSQNSTDTPPSAARDSPAPSSEDGRISKIALTLLSDAPDLAIRMIKLTSLISSTSICDMRLTSAITSPVVREPVSTSIAPVYSKNTIARLTMMKVMGFKRAFILPTKIWDL